MNRKKELREPLRNYSGNRYLSIYLSNKQSFIYIYSLLVPLVPQIYTWFDVYRYFLEKHENTKQEKIKGTWGTKIFSMAQVSNFIDLAKIKVVPKTREPNAKFQGTTFFWVRNEHA